MAKLIKNVGASLRARTHDEDDTMMKQKGATGVFRNLAFADADDNLVSTSARAMATSESTKKNNFFGGSQDNIASIDVTPRSRDAGNGASSWAHADLPTSASKRVGSTGSASTPVKSATFARTASAQKRAKNATAIQEISAFEHEHAVMDEMSGSEDGERPAGLVSGGSAIGATTSTTVIAVRSVARGPSITQQVSTSGSVRAWEEEVKRLIASGRHEDAVRWVAPSDGIIRCTVRRVKNFLGHTLAYQLFLDSGDTFVLAARKRKKSKASNFVLSTSQEDLGKDSDHCIAKLRANFVGTEYGLVSRTGGHISGSMDIDGGAQSGGKLAPPAEPFSREEIAVHYKQTALTAKGGPRTMLVATPLPEVSWAPSAADGSDSLANCLEAARRRELSPRMERQLCMLATRPPEWDPSLKAYTLDFHGRIRASSVKNFQLVHWDHNTDRKGSDLVLQFGKIDENTDDFALDFTYPLSLQKAFAIALASTDTKLCYAL
ncbi:hypothetical protein CHLRE_16g667450v5 [Chlamydomonas reinhardtii]|uniref:Tubby C-terminal domain-containing protein n=1 Tax=Chlamydomonas reinhardtii TaxID=3055 RepID=A8ISI1_CHLRE|nr:uncharacterized protein CHLRE_16g667450v5 [Chlamydomonas reinhardtii]PNW71945.1 hypothetical protein CHLRE_16g667450v5 [Chlamydomonas reinhardtii]|eukprot:XP_001692116.1 tubby-like protein [Chlamydomonas reinhardtii]